MSRIRGRDTSIELAVKPILERLGFEYQPRGIFGKPDFAHREWKVAVFIDGCFWHGCPDHCRVPDKRFWRDKIRRNVERDEQVNDNLRLRGWRVVRVWEHDLRHLVKRGEK